jgi:hypothetical protein
LGHPATARSEEGKASESVATVDGELTGSASKAAVKSGSEVQSLRYGHNGKQTVNATAKGSSDKTGQAPVEDAGNPPLPFQLKLDASHPYGASRFLSPSVIERFEMGYCGKGMMNRRWCIPIHNGEGVLVAYIGRHAGDPVPQDTAKYLLPKGFRKELELFNLHRVAGHSRVVVLVEGVFDAIRLDGLSMPAVGLFGSSISQEQLALLKTHGFSSVIVMLDSGTGKAERKLVHRISREVFVRTASLPDGEDPATVSEGFLREQVPVFEA